MGLCCHLRSVSRKRPTKYSEARISPFVGSAQKPIDLPEPAGYRLPGKLVWYTVWIWIETLGFGGFAALSHINSTTSVTRMGYPQVTWMPLGRSS